MLLPKRVKYRRVHRGRMKGKATRGNTVTYGEYGLQATEPCWITSNQSCRCSACSRWICNCMGRARVGVFLGSGKLVQLLSSMHITNHTNIIRVGAGLLAMQATRFI